MTTKTPCNFALYEAAKAADDAYQAELIRVYGPSRAQDARYTVKGHQDARLGASLAAKLAADALWLAESRRVMGTAPEVPDRANLPPLAASVVDVGTITEYGLTQKLQTPIRCF